MSRSGRWRSRLTGRLPPMNPGRLARLKRLRVWIGLSVGVGIVTGLGVTVLHLVIEDSAWGPLSLRSDWWIAALPIGGLLASSFVVARTRDRSTETTEEYVRVYHDTRAHIRAESGPFRLLASVATIALGGSLGLEGPSIFLGSLIGDLIERVFHRAFDREDAKVMLVAGAAAGISAIFKAPVTGIVFALEVPYRDDLARRALIPAMFASVSSYMVFAGIVGTAPFFPVQTAPLRFSDLLGSLVVGIGCGLGARVFIRAYRASGRLGRRLSFWRRPLVAGVVVGLVGALALALYHLPLPLGPGYNGILRAATGKIGPFLLLLLFAMKIVTTSATAAGNGVGGLFFPSVMMGAAIGGALGHVVPGPPSLFAVVGMAAFLGGAYKVPLAGVAFVAETTGAPGYIIPGLLAAAIGYLVAGQGSISLRQRFRRRSDLESRLQVTVAEAMNREWTEVPPTASIREFASRYAPAAKAKTLPVAEGGRYLGMISLDWLFDLPADRWGEIAVRDRMHAEGAVAVPEWPLNQALRLMRQEGADHLPVLRDGRIVGMIATSDILQLEEIVDTLSQQEGRGLEP